MMQRMPDSSESVARAPHLVIVVCESSSESAAEYCRQLEERYRHRQPLDIRWWSFSALGTPAAAWKAAEEAAAANTIIFSLTPAGDLPAEVKAWIERWVSKRRNCEGSLVGLVERPGGAAGVASLKEVFLRHTAHRAGMDYLSHEWKVAFESMPDSPDSYNQRAAQRTSVLDEILRRLPPPPWSL